LLLSDDAVGDVVARRDAHAQQQHGAVAAAADPDRGAMRASTSPDSAAALSSGASGDNKRERELERTGSGGVRSDEEDGADGAGGRKKLRLSKDQAAVLEECFKTHSTLNPVSPLYSSSSSSSSRRPSPRHDPWAK
jgi:homeobox-leucine zipper protein